MIRISVVDRPRRLAACVATIALVLLLPALKPGVTMASHGVASECGTAGDVLNNAAGAPANDDFSHAEQLTGATGSVAGTLVDATVQQDGFPEVDYETWKSIDDWGFGQSPTRSVWYCWTAPSGGYFEFDTSGSPSPYRGDGNFDGTTGSPALVAWMGTHWTVCPDDTDYLRTGNAAPEMGETQHVMAIDNAEYGTYGDPDFYTYTAIHFLAEVGTQYLIYVENSTSYPTPDEGAFRLNWRPIEHASLLWREHSRAERDTQTYTVAPGCPEEGAPESLLDQFAPELRYHEDETYRADSAAVMTNNKLNPQSPNHLRDGTGAILVSATNGLSLSYLRSVYPDGRIASTTDYLDANDSYGEDAQQLHTSPLYANRTYGRTVPLVDGGTILQYWMFYYNNPKTYIVAGPHVGDWEVVQVRLASDDSPVEAVYSQHLGAERCSWDRIQRTSSGRPVVYVAEGSHANYFSSGFHATNFDFTSDGGEDRVPKVIDVSLSPDWLEDWPGKWGESTSSPRSPIWQVPNIKWLSPSAWGSAATECSEDVSFLAVGAPRASEPSSRAASPKSVERPATPRVTARRVGRSVVIRYVLTQPPSKNLRVWQLITVVQSSDERYVPLTLRTRVSGLSSVIRRPLGLGKGPWELRVIAVAENGARSVPARLMLR